MQKIFNDTPDVKKTVKINKTLPFESLAPYLDDAYERYILPFVGKALMGRLEQDPEGREMELIRKTLGPLAVAMASPELAISLGDAGHTVARTDNVTVASDAKILQLEESLEERGWRNLELLLDLFSSDITKYPEWEESAYYLRQSSGHYFNSAREFQDCGKVDIHYSRLTFEKLRPVLERYELTLRKRLSPTLQDKLLGAPEDQVMAELLQYVRLWLASSVAAVFSSQATKSQRRASANVEFKPVIYPLYNDVTDTGNFYTEQATYWDMMITEYMAENATMLGLSQGVQSDFNSKDKHIFAL